MSMYGIDCLRKLGGKFFYLVFGLYPNSKHSPLSTDAVCRELSHVAEHGL